MIAITGLAAAVATPAIGQLLLGAARSPLLRGLVDLAFASPAVIAANPTRQCRAGHEERADCHHRVICRAQSSLAGAAIAELIGMGQSDWFKRRLDDG